MSDATKESTMDANGWRPIESAPKNEFVLCLMQGCVCMVLYQTDNGGGLTDTWRNASGIQAGWPTHFMPLPPPPAQEGKL